MKNKSTWGGKREGSGRKLGSISKKTAERKEAEKLFTERILKNVDRLFESQMNLALGVSYLFRIDTIQKGNKEVKETVRVEDPEEIRKYFNDELDSDSYYYITTKDPDNRSIDSLLDRTFGKAVQKNVLTGEDDGPIEFEDVSPNQLTKEEKLKFLSEILGN